MRTILSSTLPVMLFTGSVLLVYYLWIRLWLLWLVGKLRKKDAGRLLTRRASLCLHTIACIGTLCILYAWLIEPYWIHLQTITVRTNKLKQAHFRIVQVSDTHCDTRIRLEERLPGIVNSLKPDVIVFTGDTINSEPALPLFQTTLSGMDAPLGKFAVNGNWDFNYWYRLDLFKGTGFTELQLGQCIVEKDGEAILIAGAAFEKGRYHEDVTAQLSPETFNVLLYHNSDLIDFCPNKLVDLYLCGHTHGGQVTLPFYGALTTLSRHGKKYEGGLYRLKDVLFYVNRGIGMEGGRMPRIRFLARPEVAVFDIRPENP